MNKRSQIDKVNFFQEKVLLVHIVIGKREFKFYFLNGLVFLNFWINGATIQEWTK